jgi:ketosteroid isomerase-like protein
VAPENVRIVRAAFDAYLRGDEQGMLGVVSADVVATQFPDQLDVRDFHGHEGVRQLMAEWIGAWEDWTIELLAAREVGDLVVATACQRGRGRGSGAPMESQVTFIFTIRHSAIERWQMFHTEQEALEAVGLA